MIETCPKSTIFTNHAISIYGRANGKLINKKLKTLKGIIKFIANYPELRLDGAQGYGKYFHITLTDIKKQVTNCPRPTEPRKLQRRTNEKAI